MIVCPLIALVVLGIAYYKFTNVPANWKRGCREHLDMAFLAICGST